MMKKTSRILKTLLVVSLVLTFLFPLTGCGQKTPATGTAETPAVSVSPAEYFTAVWNSYKEDELFPIAGGDFDHANMETPDVYDVDAYREDFQMTFLHPDDVLAEVSGEMITAMHMMNANTFSASMFAVKDAGRIDALADSYKKAVQSNQWVCGCPDTLVVLRAGNVMITAFGEDSIIQTFKNKCTQADPAAALIVEAPVL